MLSACAAPQAPPKSRFVLLPDDTGTVGSITVSNPQGSQTLGEAWQSTAVAAAGAAPEAPTLLSADEVKARFHDALAAQAEPVRRFILYFQKGSKELTAESQALIPEVVATIRERRSVDTSVVGHTDTLGSNEANMRLSRERAAIIVTLLTDAGIDPTVLETDFHGERNLLVPTDDEVSEPRNRRVEITVR
ncbi:MAG: OmpA family protein [Trichloromonas sp.]|jgi:outer membrane protein OmpA-like peptidoglycan-associated protein|nr:OmpA family protein [Trichloromonas sp.]